MWKYYCHLAGIFACKENLAEANVKTAPWTRRFKLYAQYVLKTDKKIFCGARDWTHGLMHAKQVIYLLSPKVIFM
jgi:hypothetical protein